MSPGEDDLVSESPVYLRDGEGFIYLGDAIGELFAKHAERPEDVRWTGLGASGRCGEGCTGPFVIDGEVLP